MIIHLNLNKYVENIKQKDTNSLVEIESGILCCVKSNDLINKRTILRTGWGILKHSVG